MSINKRQLKKKFNEDIHKAYLRLAKALKTTMTLIPQIHRDGEDWWGTRMSQDGFSTGISLKNLNGFKDPKLAEVLERLIMLNPVRMSSADYPANYNRDYHFSFNGLQVSVYAYINSDSPTCKKVVTGERYVAGYVEQTYAFECDGDA